MTDYPWFAVVDDDDLQQGDLLFECALDRVLAPSEADRSNYDVVIMSHSCDLANDKLEIVQVCPFWNLQKLAGEAEYFRSKRGKEELRRGNLPGYHLLNSCPLHEKPTDFLVIDFRSQFAVEFSQLK